jgi:hypothetical protein
MLTEVYWVIRCSRYGERLGAYRGFVGRPEGKRLLGNPISNGRLILKFILKNWGGEME